MNTRLLFICGSGISIERPSCLPGVSDILAIAEEYCLPKETELDRKFSRLVISDPQRGIQPEVLFEQATTLLGPECLRFWEVLRQPSDPNESCSKDGGPNLYHYLLTSIAADHCVPILTLNFDTYLEEAAEKLGFKLNKYVPGIKESERILASPLKPGEVSLWKLHGCIDTTDERGNPTIENTMSQIARPNERLLSAFEGYTQYARICVIGYSGRDSDFFPHMVRISRKTAGRAIQPLWIDPEFEKSVGFGPARLTLADRCRLLGAIPIHQDAVTFLQKIQPESLAKLRKRDSGHNVECAEQLWNSRTDPQSVHERTKRRSHLIRLHKPNFSSFRKVPLVERRALLTSLLLHSGNFREGYIYAKAHMHTFRGSLPPYILAKSLLDFARLCDWNSKYEQFKVAAIDALRAEGQIAGKGHEEFAKKSLVRIGGICLLTRARHMLMGPFMEWPDSNLSFRMDFWFKLKWFFMQALALLRMHYLLANFREPRTLRRFMNGIARIRLQPPGFGSPVEEVLAWHYYLDHKQLFGNQFLKGLGPFGKFLDKRFLDSLERDVRLAGSTYTQADVYLFRFRNRFSGDVVLAQHLWSLVANPVGLALILRDEGRNYLNERPVGIYLNAAQERFRECYRVAHSSGSHLTALKALIGLHSAKCLIERQTWTRHINRLEGKAHKKFFSRVTGYMEQAGGFRTGSGKSPDL